uniref:DUF4249 domain-containing protein n=3 Tax=Sphingobacteriaceae TaxID=84566 RepID=F4C2I6_SPHS2
MHLNNIHPIMNDRSNFIAYTVFKKYWNRLFSIICLTVGVLLSSSCEKEIDIELKGADQRYVIEGVITDQEGGCKVLISKTKDFNDDNSRVTVTGAQVFISEGAETHELQETEVGTYTAPTLRGLEGHTYNLRVQIGTEIFTSSSTMPALVKMDSLYIVDDLIFGDNYKLPTIDFQDPANVVNSYRFLLYVNGVKKKQIFVINDELSNGKANSIRLYADVGEDEDNPENRRIRSGDLVRVEMLGIDQAVYKYFFSLDNSATGENQSATPSNPVSNIQGNALGYFSAHNIQSKEISVP